MQGYYFIYMVVLELIPETLGSFVNSPCKKTSDWSKYVVRCPANHTIYITKHVIEDGFQGLLSPALGCSVSDAVYCGVELPTNNTISLKNHDILESVVNICNGQTECTLTKKYFLDAEAAVKKLCDASARPELQRASFRQSIDYECIQNSQIMAMCLLENGTRHFNQPVYLKASEANCSCTLNGSVTLVKILQTISVKLMIQSIDGNIFENPHTDVGLYGVDFPVEAENSNITIVVGSNSSLALMKILIKGNISIHCTKDRNLRISQSTVKTLRRAFQMETTNGTTSVMGSTTDMYIESRTNNQVLLFNREKRVGYEISEKTIGSPIVASTLGDVLSWIQTFFIFCLFVFAFLTCYKKRTAGHNSVAISIKDKEEKIMLVCHLKDEKKITKIEIHQGDCMCATNNEREGEDTFYTPLQRVEEVENSNQTSRNDEYLDVV